MLRISKYFWTDFRKLFMLEIVKKKKKEKAMHKKQTKKKYKCSSHVVKCLAGQDNQCSIFNTQGATVPWRSKYTIGFSVFKV